MPSGEKWNNHILITFVFFSFLYSTQSSKSPSYYYEQCAPSVCGNSVIQFLIGLKPLCRSAYISTSCENNSVYITQDEAPRTKYRVLDTMNSTVYAPGYFMLVDTSLLGCAPIPPFLDQDWQMWFKSGNFLMSTDYKTGTFFNCSQASGTHMLARLSEAPCLDCGNTSNPCYSKQMRKKVVSVYASPYYQQLGRCQAIVVLSL